MTKKTKGTELEKKMKAEGHPKTEALLYFINNVDPKQLKQVMIWVIVLLLFLVMF